MSLRRAKPIIDFRAAEASSSAAIGAWNRLARPDYSARAVREALGPPGLRWTVWGLPSLAIGRLRAGPHIVARSPKAAGRSDGFVKLRIYLRGGARLFGQEESVSLRPMVLHVIDQSRPWITQAARHESVSVFAAHDDVGYDPAVHPIVASLPIAPGFLSAIVALGWRLGGAGLEWDDERLAGLLAATRDGLARFADGATRESLEARRLQSAKAIIESKLEDPSLGVRDIASSIGAARATVYRDFRGEGGVGRYIARRRLERAFAELAAQPPIRGNVARLSERWGFASASHFSAAFLLRFGMRPSEAAGMAAFDWGTTSAKSTYQRLPRRLRPRNDAI